MARDYTPRRLRLERKSISRIVSLPVSSDAYEAKQTLAPGHQGTKKSLERYANN